MKVATSASSVSASMPMRTKSKRIAAAVLIACIGSASTTWAAESVEAQKKVAAEEREAAERERKLNDARKRLDAAAREVAELSRAMSEDAMPRVARIMSRQASRAMLGVNIGGSDRSGDERQEGVEIVSVSPGGPAAEAGLKAGDILIELKDKSLKQDGKETPREKLLAVMRDVDPEEKIKVRYLRNGKAATATVTADRTDSMFTMPLRVQGWEHLPTFAFMRSHGAFGSAELVALTPKLGQYFGADKGLLVVRAPADSRLKLEEGDVLLDIDGRVPNSTSHAVRILSSYQPGEKMKLNVMRMKQRMAIDITVPEDVFEHRYHVDPDTVVPAVPPMPPTPPAPPPGARSDTA